MKKRFKNFSLISIGVIFGILVSINLSVFADKKEEAKKTSRRRFKNIC